MASAIYTDLSQYYDLMCVDINYQEQSEHTHRLNQIFGNGGSRFVDLACGTAPHMGFFLQAGFVGTGVDINQPMLDIAHSRCPAATFIQGDMCELPWQEEVDLICCFLYSIHYNQSLDKLRECFAHVHRSLTSGGVFCFNSVDKHQIDNRPGIRRTSTLEHSQITFQSSWFYSGEGDQQELRLRIEKQTGEVMEQWQDHHTMVALGIEQLTALLAPYFAVTLFEHNHQAITPWQGTTGNVIVVAVKR